MKRVSKKELLAMNHEVVYSADKGNPEGLLIKTETLPNNNDFIYLDLCGNTDSTNGCQHYDWITMAEHDSEFDIPLTFECCNRDGAFEDDFYYVYTKDEVQRLINRLNEALATM